MATFPEGLSGQNVLRGIEAKNNVLGAAEMNGASSQMRTAREHRKNAPISAALCCTGKGLRARQGEVHGSAEAIVAHAVMLNRPIQSSSSMLSKESLHLPYPKLPLSARAAYCKSIFLNVKSRSKE